MSTLAWRRRAVERVVAELRRRFAEPLTLEDMARVAICSPYHFNRIFRHVTGLPPCRFLAALRLAEAKRLLVTTGLSVTEICYRVGYGSLGTFTSCFTLSVGAAPCAFRRAAMSGKSIALHLAATSAQARGTGLLTPVAVCAGGASSIVGRVVLADGPSSFAAIGLFERPLPRGRPVACTLARSGGDFSMEGVRDGRYHLFAIALGAPTDPAAFFLTEYAPRARGGMVQMRAGPPQHRDVVLRPPRLTDPPILLAVPLLIAERFDGDRAA